MKLLTSVAAAISFFVVGTKPALADERWSTGDELVQYWEDQGNRTVIYKKGKNFYIFLDGVKTDLEAIRSSALIGVTGVIEIQELVAIHTGKALAGGKLIVGEE